MAHPRASWEREQRVFSFQSTCYIKTISYAMKTALESALVVQLFGEDSDVYIGADEDYDCEAIDVSCGSDMDLSVQSISMDKASVQVISTSQRHLMISTPSQL
uniref:Uncharacterized protein n=1 Tax=Peronospora matthiolae TaxID=2874970 RepID=A0AAV1T9D7_9STRA